MTKAHSPINWENEPSYNTPINEANLNKMDSTIGILDDRIIEQETSKLDKATAYTMVKDISFNENNGVFTITLLNGSTKTLDTKLEKIAINFSYNAETQQIEIILIDGTKQYIDISSLVSPIDFVDSDTIGWEVTSDWKVKAKVLDGSITEDMLQPNYLAEIKVETEKSAQSMTNAKISENNAKQSELNAKESEEKALEYSNNAQPLAQSVTGNNPTATNSTDGSVIYLNNKGYTQQDGTPSPDNPIRIGGLADKGYFDGELKQGYYAIADGKFNGSTKWVSCSNPIYCKPNDIVKISYEEVQSVSIVYFNGSTFVSGETSSKANEYTFTVPSGVDRFYFNVNNTKEITPSTAKHISVTINGQYAVRVKTTNKNIFGGIKLAQALNSASATSEIDTVNKTVTFDHHKTNAEVLFDNFKVDTQYTFILNGNTVATDTRNNSLMIRYTDGTTYAIDFSSINKNVIFTTQAGKSVLHLELTWGYGSLAKLYYNQCGIFEGVITEEEFEEYQETVANIPVSSPLYEGDYIEVYADGSGQIVRTMNSITFDGSESNWQATYLGEGFYINVSNAREISDNIFCNQYKHVPDVIDWIDGNILVSVSKNMCFGNSSITTLDEWKALLGGNPIHVVYELATPTTEPLTAEQVAEFMKLQTFNPVTHITADGEVTVRYYCNNDSGDTVARLSGEISSVSDKFSSDIEELQEDIKAVSADIEEQIEIKGCWGVYGDWATGDKAGSGALKSVAYGNYRFVAVDNSGVTYYSFDGSKWFTGIITNTSALNSVTYGNGLFVAVGASGVTFYSEDGITWTAGDKVSSGVYLTSVTYGNGIFVAVGYSAGVYYSEDGVTWNTANGIPTISNLIFNGVTYGDGRFVVVGTGNAYFSLDGKTWSSGQYGGNTVLISVTYGNGRFVAVGYDGVTYYADNGASWIPGGTAGNTTLYSVTYGDGLFVVVDVSGTTYYSEDGVTWTEGGSAGSGALYGITYGKNRFVAVGTSSATYCKEKDNIAESVKDLCQTVSDITQSVTDLSNTNTYSSEEVVCGTWLGKTLYQKTFSVSALEETPHSLDDVEQIWIDDTMSFYEFIDGSTSSISGSTATCTVDKTNIMFSDIGNTSMLSTAYITLKYIKLS